MSEFDEESGETSRRQRWITLGLVMLLVGGGIAWWKLGSRTESAASRVARITTITLPPLPKIPTPPPVLPPEQKVVETKPRMDDVPKEEAAKPAPIKPVDEPPPSMGSNIKGAGNDGFGLSGSGSGGRVGFGGTGRGGGNGFGAYAARLKSQVAVALRANARTRTATFNTSVKVWIDGGGRITRAEPMAGDSPAAAIVGLRLEDAPPVGMNMPITLRLAATRPN